MKNTWLLKRKGKRERKFPSFEDAVTAMKEEIISVIKQYSKDNTILGFKSYFDAKRQNGTITNEELIIESRLSMLIDSLYYPDRESAKWQALKSIKQKYFYDSDTNQNQDVLCIHIDRIGNEISLNLNSKERSNRTENHEDSSVIRKLQTNAFVFKENEKERYYFVLRASSAIVEDNREEIAEEEITLTKQEDKSKDPSEFSEKEIENILKALDGPFKKNDF